MSAARRMVEPLHTWHVGRGKAQSTVMLLEPPADAVAEHARPSVPLLFLSELWVPPHARRRGYAHQLMQGAVDWADANKTDLWLYCAPHGVHPRCDVTALADLYNQYGFVRVALNSPDYEMLRRVRK